MTKGQGIFRNRDKCMKNFTGMTICFLIFCMGCQQDPFGHYPDSIKNASSKRNPFYIRVSDFRDQMIFENIASINADSDIWLTFVNDDFSIEIRSHVSLDNRDFNNFKVELVSPVLVNENHTFIEVADSLSRKEKKYVFRWSPSESFLGHRFLRIINLEFQLSTTGHKNINISKSFPVFIYKTSSFNKHFSEYISLESEFIDEDTNSDTDYDYFPQITGPTNLIIYKGKSHYFKFFVENPFDGNLSINEIINSDLSNTPGHFISHQIEKRDDGFDVNFIWTLPDTIDMELDEYDLNIEMVNEFNHNGKHFVKKKSHKIAARILDLPTDAEIITDPTSKNAKSNVKSSTAQTR